MCLDQDLLDVFSLSFLFSDHDQTLSALFSPHRPLPLAFCLEQISFPTSISALLLTFDPFRVADHSLLLIVAPRVGDILTREANKYSAFTRLFSVASQYFHLPSGVWIGLSTAWIILFLVFGGIAYYLWHFGVSTARIAVA